MSTLSILIVFLIAAAIGIRLVLFLKKGERRPIPWVAAHGIFAVTAYGCLIYRIAFEARTESGMPLESLAFTAFSFAAVGGFVMLITDKILNKSIPKWLPVLHGLLAVTGVVVLIVSLFTGN